MTTAHAAVCPVIDPSTGTPNPAPSAGVDWSGCNLTNAALQNADLSNANLTQATLDGANLSGANLSGATLSNVTGTGTNLTGATLDNAVLSGLLQTVKLANASLNGTDLGNLGLMAFSSGGITGTPKALPYQVELVSGGYLIGQRANLAHASLAGLSLAGDRLDYADLSGADLSSADLHGANVTYTDLSGANLTGANLNASVWGSDMMGAKLDGTIMAGANLDQVSSGSVTGTPASLPANWLVARGYLVGPAADLTKANLVNIDLTGVDLAGAEITSASFYSSNLTNASLAGDNLNGTDFTNTNLTGADFSGTYQNFAATWSNTTCPDGSNSDQHAPAGCQTPLDTKAPVAAPSVKTGLAGASGWYHSAVTVAWNWTDDGTINQSACPQESTAQPEGAAVTVTATCTDGNGNTGQSSYQVKIDTTPPDVAVTGVANGGHYVTGSVTPGCSTTDSLSGVATDASLQYHITGTPGAGVYLGVTCTGGSDVAGNPQAKLSPITFTVGYGISGFTAPKSGAVLAKAAKTIVVSFRLTDSAGKPIPAATAANLASIGWVKAAIAGPAITKKTVTCKWNSTSKVFRCAIPTPAGIKTGSASHYSITALENMGGGFYTVPAVGGTADPETVSFR